MTVKEQIGSNIRKMRELRGMTIRQLADALADNGYKVITDNTIGGWQRGERTIPADALVYIAKALQCTAYTLYADTGITDPLSGQRAMHEFCTLPQHEQNILVYLATEWWGNMHCLIECCLMYSCLPEKLRVKVARKVCQQFIAGTGHLGKHWEDVDMQKVIAGCQNLGKGQDSAERDELQSAKKESESDPL